MFRYDYTMNAPIIPQDERQRLDALNRYQILDTPRDQVFDDITHLAASVCNTQYAIIGFIDSHRHWIKSSFGIAINELPRDISFCTQALNTSNQLKVMETTTVGNNDCAPPLTIHSQPIRFYAGAKLITHDGYIIGTLCVFDPQSLKLTEQQIASLEALARQVMMALELNFEHSRLAQLLGEYEQQARELKVTQEEYRSLVDTAQDMIFRTDSKGYLTFTNDGTVHLLGYTKEELKGKHFTEFIKPEFRENVQSLYDLQLRKKKENTYFEVPVVTKKGDLLWFGQNVQTIFVGDTVVGFQAVARNITERKQWEELREKLILELEEAVYNAKTLSGLLPICSSCKKIRDDQGYWKQVEGYIMEHSEATFTHGMCPECMKTMYPEYMSKQST